MSKELEFADAFGRHFKKQYAMPPMAGRVVGWLLLCDPADPTAQELADALQVSRSAIGTAVGTLEHLALIRTFRRPGERADRYTVDPSFGAKNLDSPAEYESLAALARTGMEALGDVPSERKERLRELEAFAEFLKERTPQLLVEWHEHWANLNATKDT